MARPMPRLAPVTSATGASEAEEGVVCDFDEVGVALEDEFDAAAEVDVDVGEDDMRRLIAVQVTVEHMPAAYRRERPSSS